MQNVLRIASPARRRALHLVFSLAVLALAPLGCRAQTPTVHLTPELSRRILIKIRDRAALPFNYDLAIVDQKAGIFPGYDQITVRVTTDEGKTQDLPFLIASDGKSVAQFNSFDISQDPATITTDAGRPARGGPESAPVHIVVFDDLQCPYCARMHTQLFPALLDRYGNSVRIVYKDFPLSQHHWAIHAAVDAGCLAAQPAPASTAAYWQFVDHMHGHLSEIGAGPATPEDKASEDKAIARAAADVDRIARDTGRENHLDAAVLDACLAKQDTTAVKASMTEGDRLGIDGVPTLFINGERLTGAVPVEYVWRAIDRALTAKGLNPPPPPAPQKAK